MDYFCNESLALWLMRVHYLGSNIPLFALLEVKLPGGRKAILSVSMTTSPQEKGLGGLESGVEGFRSFTSHPPFLHPSVFFPLVSRASVPGKVLNTQPPGG